MTVWDWIVALSLNGLVFGLGAVLSRRTRTDSDWLLAGRSLPFWVAGLSMFATSLDAGEQISVSGHSYTHGISILSHYWLGLPIAYIVAAFWVVPQIYRAGMYTNAEYLETRFGNRVRTAAVLVQIQYRTNILASMSIALHLVLTEVVKLPASQAWLMVVALAGLTTFYTAMGGLKTMAVTDGALSLIMGVSTVAFWWILLEAAGGWRGATQSLQREGSAGLLHIGWAPAGEPHPLVTVLQWVIIAVGFVVVNHTQTMKMLGTRSLWDLKMSVLVAMGVMAPIIFLNSTFAVLGRVALPEAGRLTVEARPDKVFPVLMDVFLAPGFKGLVVAGVIAAAVSTYEGIGSALGALVTRDLYARLWAPQRSHGHYLRVCGLATGAVVCASFAYIPFILRFGTMMAFFLRITNVFVTPLMTIYLMGAFTSVHRKSAGVGLCVGPAFGILSLATDGTGLLPAFLTEPAWTYLWSVVLTAASMFLATVAWGRDRRTAAWSAPQTERPRGWMASPSLWAGVALGLALFFVFHLFW